MIERDVGGILWDSDKNKDKRLISSNCESTFLLESLLYPEGYKNVMHISYSYFFELADAGIYIASSTSGKYIGFVMTDQKVLSFCFSAPNADGNMFSPPHFYNFGVVKSKNILYVAVSYQSGTRSPYQLCGYGYQIKITNPTTNPSVDIKQLFHSSNAGYIMVAASEKYAVFSGTKGTTESYTGSNLWVISNHDSPTNILQYTPAPWPTAQTGSMVIQGDLLISTFMPSASPASISLYKFDLILKTTSSTEYTASDLANGDKKYVRIENVGIVCTSSGKKYLLANLKDATATATTRSLSFFELNQSGGIIFKKIISNLIGSGVILWSHLRFVDTRGFLLCYTGNSVYLLDLNNFAFKFTDRPMVRGNLFIVNSSDLISLIQSGATSTPSHYFVKIKNECSILPWWTLTPGMDICWAVEYGGKIYIFGEQSTTFIKDSTATSIYSCLSLIKNKKLGIVFAI